MNSLHIRNRWISLIAATLLLFSFQNCSPVHMSKDEAPTVNKNTDSENGGPYGGLLKVYRYYSSVQPCQVADLNGRALPNTEILVKPNEKGLNAPYLARENCSDLNSPTLIADSDLKLTDSSFQTVTYKSFVMTSQNAPGEFDVVAAQCPVGKTATGAARTNLFAHSLDWTIYQEASTFATLGTQGWYNYPGIGVGLYSTIQSLPAYLVRRNDPNYLDLWRRLSGGAFLKANTDYVVSYLVQAGQTPAADIYLFRGVSGGSTDETMRVTYNFQNQTATVQYALNVTNVTSTIQPVGTNAYLISLYFRTSSVANQSPTDIGLAPSTSSQSFGQLGDSIVGTAAQLVEVATFCR